MIWGALQSFWHFLYGWAGVNMLVGFACVAVAIFETWIINSLPPFIGRLIPDLRKWAIAGAVIAFTCMGCIAYGFKNGSDEKQRQWDAALAGEAVRGEAIRGASERAVPGTSDRWVLNDDPFNRNRRERDPEHKGPVRWLAVNPFRRME